ncbi:MAG: glycosyl transferase [Burkholderiales bacterium 66-5]|nr:MAG: glycosyl transferase [Burkholderiales bacterium 66-5]
MSDNTASAIGLVVIGRNEGERLRRCLQSVLGEGRQVVYVDSGSTDGSVELARSLGAQVVALDMRQPFTAARARNAGWRALLLQAPQVRYVQFIDGDCEMNAGWLAAAQAFLDGHPQHAVVAGRLRERHPERSIYNRLCDIEWDTPVGDTKACGGIAMVRATPLQAVGGFRDDLIAGEEPELCVRLRAAGWKIYRLDAEMALHDAAMLHWRQWWRRTMRGGFAYAQGAWLHGAAPERHWVRETMRALAWGAGVPLLALVAVVAFGAWGLAVVLIYPLQMLRLALKMRDPRRAFFLVAGKWAEAWGAIRFYWGRLLQRRQGIIEYK